MNTYVILRRDGWGSGDELRLAAERSTAAGEEMPDDVRWIRSYVLEESSGSVGTVCIYQATSPEAIRRHAGEGGPAGQRDHPGRRHGLREAGPRTGSKLRTASPAATRPRRWRLGKPAAACGGPPPMPGTRGASRLCE